MKDFLRENWFKIGILALILFGLNQYLGNINDRNVLQSRIEYADCRGKLGTLDQKENDDNLQLDMAIFQSWDSACNGILTYK